MFKAAGALRVVSSGLIDRSEFLQIERTELELDRGFCRRPIGYRCRADRFAQREGRGDAARSGKVNGAHLRRRRGRRESVADSVSAFWEMTRRGYCHDYITLISPRGAVYALRDYIYRAPARSRDRDRDVRRARGLPEIRQTAMPSANGGLDKERKKKKKKLTRTTTYLSKQYRGRITVISARREFYDVVETVVTVNECV